jgi:hypothetical protein
MLRQSESGGGTREEYLQGAAVERHSGFSVGYCFTSFMIA